MSSSKGRQSSQRRYPPEIRERSVRMVAELRAQDPADHGVIARVARQLVGMGVGKHCIVVAVELSGAPVAQGAE